MNLRRRHRVRWHLTRGREEGAGATLVLHVAAKDWDERNRTSELLRMTEPVEIPQADAFAQLRPRIPGSSFLLLSVLCAICVNRCSPPCATWTTS